MRKWRGGAMGKRLPDHCCCCGLRPGAIVIGCFVLAVCIPFMTILGMRSYDINSRGKDLQDSYYMTIYMYWLTAALNAIEVLMTIGLFWGIYKRREQWVTRWLFVSVGWWTEHSVFSMAILMSSSRIRDLVLASFVGPFLFFLGYRCLKTVAGLREEMLCEGDVEDPRPQDSTADRPADASAGANASASASASANAEDNVQL